MMALVHRRRISAALNGKPKSAEHARNVGATRRGVPRSRSAKANISNGLKGKAKSPEHRLKISLALRGRIKSARHAKTLAAAHADRKSRSWSALREAIRRPSVRLDRQFERLEIHEILNQLISPEPNPLQRLIEKEEYEEWERHERRFWQFRNFSKPILSIL